jgi:hypothetical protein
MILAIDPGNVESAFVLMDENLKPVEFGKIPNEEMLSTVNTYNVLQTVDNFAIEMVASYGMPVGESIFETVFWIGRFWEETGNFKRKARIYRKDVKMNLCGSMKAKDSNIRQALIDRFGVVGVKKNPGWFYGFKADIWSAYAVGVTYYDTILKARSRKDELRQKM